MRSRLIGARGRCILGNQIGGFCGGNGAGNTALLYVCTIGVYLCQWWVEGGKWSEVYYIPQDFGFVSCISPENEHATFYEIHVYCGIGCLKHYPYHN